MKAKLHVKLHAWVGGVSSALPTFDDDLYGMAAEAAEWSHKVEQPAKQRYQDYVAICRHIDRLRTTSAPPKADE